MAKQKTSGPVRYHNLAGLMRDLRKALDNGDQECYEFAELVIECDELVDGGSTSEEDDGDCATDGDSPEVASHDPALRVPGEGTPERPAQGRGARGTAASRLDSALDHLAGEERVEAQRELDQLRMHSMGAPVVRVVKKGRQNGTK